MKQLTHDQFNQIESYVKMNGRELEQTMWDTAFHHGPKEAIVEALRKYQNGDGGFGNGLEADIQMPDSSSIASAEAILIAYEYDLDCKAEWFKELLAYLEQTISKDGSIQSFWEKVPSTVEEHPHAPWWTYAPEERFSPNPSAIIATAFMRYGNESQKRGGRQIAERCIDFLMGDAECTMHDCFCLQVLMDTLQELQSELWSEDVARVMDQRILACLSTDSSQWTDYVAQPLDFVTGPGSQWAVLMAPYIEKNIDYWIDTLNEEGYWQPNFSWGEESDLAEHVTVVWRCVMALKRTKKLRNFRAITFE